MSKIPGYRIIGPLCYAGKQGCEDVRCTHIFKDGKKAEDHCRGYHCSYCDEPCGGQGHRCDAAVAILDEAARLAAPQHTEAAEQEERSE